MRGPFVKFRIESNAVDHEEKIDYAVPHSTYGTISRILEDQILKIFRF
jgi:hypothetical protein